MKIQDRSFVTLDIKLTLDSGELIQRSEPGKPLKFIMGLGQMVKGLERQLMGMTPGESARITVEPHEGYGPPTKELIQELPRGNFPPELDLKPGMSFQADGPHGAVGFMVKEVTDQVVVADFNHPLAGERLHFDVLIRDVRKVTQLELDALKEGKNEQAGQEENKEKEQKEEKEGTKKPSSRAKKKGKPS